MRFLRRALVAGAATATIVAATGPVAPAAPAYQPQWRKLSTSAGSSGYGGMAWDTARGEVVYYNGASGETWVWDGVTWTRRLPSTWPGGRTWASFAYDGTRERFVAYGGYRAGTQLGDTWTWNGTTWTQQFPATSPPGRLGAAMAHDPASGDVVLFGGMRNGAYLAETWVWNGSTWAQRFPATSPPGRRAASMAYDSARGEIVLFGGEDGSGWRDDTWVFDGSTWTQRAAAVAPAPRRGAAMVDDQARDLLVLFGGETSAGAAGDTWAWDGTAWRAETPATTAPARAFAGSAYDPARAEVVLAGGVVGTGYLTDSWAYGVPALEPSDDCDADPVLQGYASDSYLRAVVEPQDSRTVWVCLHAESSTVRLGGKAVVTVPLGTPGTPRVDSSYDACHTASGNTLPGPRPLLSGEIGDPDEPATHAPYSLDLFAGSNAFWLCVRVGDTFARVIVPVSTSVPTVTWAPDRTDAPHRATTQPWPGTPSAACKDAPSAKRLLDATASGTALWAYSATPGPGEALVCVRAEGIADVGGVLAVDTGNAPGVAPVVTTSSTDLTPCTSSIASGETPLRYSVSRSPIALPASLCLSIGGTALRVTVAVDSDTGEGTVTWSPDPGTPGA